MTRSYNRNTRAMPARMQAVSTILRFPLSTFIVFLVMTMCDVAFGQTISTIAGGGAGDGGVLSQAILNHPTGIFMDTEGNLYIADRDNHRIRKVDTSGVITTVAGDGNAGFSGDGKAATDARLSSPTGVFVDTGGNLYVADGDNHRIRKVDTSGVIATVVGDGNAGFSGDGKAATDARLSSPTGVFVDTGGNLYIADRDNHRIRYRNSSGIVITIAGGGSFGDKGLGIDARLASPSDVFVDVSGNVYIADRGNNRIRKVDTSGIISTVAFETSLLNEPSGVFGDSLNNIYIASTGKHRIIKVNWVGPTGISVVAGNGDFASASDPNGDGGSARAARVKNPSGVSLDTSGNIYIADSGNNRIRKVDTSGIISTVAGTIYPFARDTNRGFSGAGILTPKN